MQLRVVKLLEAQSLVLLCIFLSLCTHHGGHYYIQQHYVAPRETCKEQLFSENLTDEKE